MSTRSHAEQMKALRRFTGRYVLTNNGRPWRFQKNDEQRFGSDLSKKYSNWFQYVVIVSAYYEALVIVIVFITKLLFMKLFELICYSFMLVNLDFEVGILWSEMVTSIFQKQQQSACIFQIQFWCKSCFPPIAQSPLMYFLGTVQQCSWRLYVFFENIRRVCGVVGGSDVHLSGKTSVTHRRKILEACCFIFLR